MNRQFKILLLAVLICLGQNALGSEIIHGNKAPEGKFLHMASLQINDKHVCGGFLISGDFVVTAAHCGDSLERVVLGTHNLKAEEKTVRNISLKCKHPLYQKTALRNDIMLLKLSSEVEPSTRLQFIQLPNPDTVTKENEICSVAGWGMVRTNGGAVDDLRVVDVKVISPEVCQKVWGELPPNVICAGGYETQSGFCQGDSGGPLMCNEKAVGVVSFNRSLNCEYPDNPNVYVDIAKYLTWIKKVLMEKSC
ncbi:granzyme B(G,H)-like [Aulostomus maculatus]